MLCMLSFLQIVMGCTGSSASLTHRIHLSAVLEIELRDSALSSSFGGVACGRMSAPTRGHGCWLANSLHSTVIVSRGS